MKTFERILLKVVMIQIIALFISQYFLLHTPLQYHMSKLPKYEGVTKEEPTDYLETIQGF